MAKKTMEFRSLVANQTETGLALAREFFSSPEGRSSNLVFSPLSFHVLLSMLASGSSGHARDQILDFLNAGSTDDLHSLFSNGTSSLVTQDDGDGDKTPTSGIGKDLDEEVYGPPPKMSMANGIWLDKSLPPSDTFRKVVNNVYQGSFFPADFINEPEAVEDSVNRWVKDKTKGLIQKIIARGQLCGSPPPVLVLANALYFKAAWVDSFYEERTKEEDFFLPDNSTIRVPVMNGGGMERTISVFDGFKALGLPYSRGKYYRDSNNGFWMYFFLPESNDGLPSLAERLFSGPESLGRYIPHGYTEVPKLKIPKFKMTWDIEATEILDRMGIEGLFRPGGLEEMLEKDDPYLHSLQITRVYHKSFIEVKEQGTEACGVTIADDEMSFSFYDKPEPPPAVDFVADHPFLFVIREEETKMVLFIGQVINPSLEC